MFPKILLHIHSYPTFLIMCYEIQGQFISHTIWASDSQTMSQCLFMESHPNYYNRESLLGTKKPFLSEILPLLRIWALQRQEPCHIQPCVCTSHTSPGQCLLEKWGGKRPERIICRDFFLWNIGAVRWLSLRNGTHFFILLSWLNNCVGSRKVFNPLTLRNLVC